MLGPGHILADLDIGEHFIPSPYHTQELNKQDERGTDQARDLGMKRIL